MAPGTISPQPVAAQFSSPVVKPILKRKRSPESPQKIQQKRAKVAFEPEIEQKIAQDAGEKDVALIREEITHAIRNREGSAKENYDEIKAYFSLGPAAEDVPSNSLLNKYLSGLIANATILNRSHSDLVQIVLHHPWLARDDIFVSLYIQFLGHLVSSQGGYLQHVLKMLVENLAHLSTSAGHDPAIRLPTRSILRDRVHKALKYILRVVPSSSNTLASIIRSCFPYADESRKAHVQYVRNLLRLTEYCPELKSDILDLVTDRLIKLDVEVQIDVEELEEDVGEILAQSDSLTSVTNPQPYDEDEELPSDDEAESEPSLDQEARRFKELGATVQKMDALLDILFTTYDTSFSKSDTSPTTSSTTMDLLLSQFHKTILPTYRSRHTQFILFHFAQTSPQNITRFIDTCLTTLKSRSDSIQRVGAAAYLASFIARGARIPAETVTHAFNSLATYASALKKQYEPGCRAPDRRRYHVYYAVVQALIYIFCFRWRDLLSESRSRTSSVPTGPGLDTDSDASDAEDDEDALLGGLLTWPPHIKDPFLSNFHSSLNPLKVCAPEVVDEFARLAHRLNLLYIYPLLNSNRRIRLQNTAALANGPASALGGVRETTLDQLRGDRHLQLDAYFPFDPYALPVSKRWLEGDYNFWREVEAGPQAVAGQTEGKGYDDDTSSEESEEEEVEEVDGEEVDGETATPGSE